MPLSNLCYLDVYGTNPAKNRGKKFFLKIIFNKGSTMIELLNHNPKSESCCQMNQMKKKPKKFFLDTASRSSKVLTYNPKFKGSNPTNRSI
jgi:hypothetical protein